MQREAGPHTVASYPDTFRLLAVFARDEFGKPPQEVCFDDLGTDFYAGFLEQLESRRGNGARTRNPVTFPVHCAARPGPCGSRSADPGYAMQAYCATTG